MNRIITIVGFCLSVSVTIAWRPPVPRVFLIGDSISIQYGAFLKDYLGAFAYFERKDDHGKAERNLDVPTGANGGDSRMVLAYLRKKTADPTFRPNYLLLNCGLHDIKRDTLTGAIQIDSSSYRQNLTAIFKICEEAGIQVIWIRTTPVVDAIHNRGRKTFRRYAADLDAYNHIADQLCRIEGIPVIDLHGLSVSLGREAFIDHVHYSESGSMAQAGYIAGFVQSYIADDD